MKFVIIREDFNVDKCKSSSLPVVVNTIYDNPDTLEYIEKWLSNYMNQEIKSLLYIPIRQDESSISYEIEENDGGRVFSLIKKYKRIEKGYLYNRNIDVYEKLFDIKVIEDEELSSNLSKNIVDMNDERTLIVINDEVNQRVIKTLEREALQVYLNDMRNSIKSKKIWNTDELLHLESQMLRQIKKKLTNKIKKTVIKEFSDLNADNKKNIEDNIPTFKLEYTVLNKYGKKD